MTVFRNNPLLMTVMGANPGPRRKRPVDDPIDRAIGQAWARLMSGVQVPIMDIPRIFRDVKLEMAAGMSLEEAVMRVGQRFQVNRNPSLVASLAGGLAGAAVTYAMSNPGPDGFYVWNHSGGQGGQSVAWYATRAEAERVARQMNYRGGAHYTVRPAGKIATRECEMPVRGGRCRLSSGHDGMHDPSGWRVAAPNPGPAFIVIDSASGVVQFRRAASGTGDQAFKACHHRAYDMARKLGRSFLVFLDIGGHQVGARLSLPMVRVQGATEVEPGGGSGRANPLTEAEHRQVMRQASWDREVASHYRGKGDAFKDGEFTGRSLRGKELAHNLSPKSNPGSRNGKRKITMTIEQFAKWVRARRDPAMWKAFLAKFRGYEKWTHGSKSRKVTVEWQNVPGVDGLWITYDGGKQPESTYIMPKGSKRKGAWKHPWDTMPDIKHDPEAGVVLTKLRGRSKITDFYHR